METLSHLPSTPSLKSRASCSNFFEAEPPGSTSRPVSRRSDRPGSSRRVEGFNPPPMPQSLTRPGSSSGPGQDVSANPLFGAQLPPMESSPARGRTPKTLMRTPSKSGLYASTLPKTAVPSGPHVPRSKTPSPEKPRLAAALPIESKTLSARPSQTRPSVNGIFKKPSALVLDKTSKPIATSRKDSLTSQKSSTTASGEETVFSAASTTSAQTAASGDTSPQFKKASAALREQIARAKAAKRAAAQQVQLEPPPANGPLASPVIPTDNSFDFGLADDPFNLKRDASSTAKVLQSRVAVARTSGRLNIAALGLKEIPSEVLNMYNLDSIGPGGGNWAESVDLTRFVAADNELEMIEEALFPDIDPEELAEAEDAQVCMFGGLETLDLHGNMLISLPVGLRRLSLLTSLNLVCSDP